MAGQVKRTLKLSAEGIKKANEALANSFVTKSELATHISNSRTKKKGASGKNTTGISRTTIDEFFDGSPKNAKIFKEICAALKLNWQDVADVAERCEPQPLASLPTSIQTRNTSNQVQDVDDLVKQVRSRLHDDIQRLHSTMPLWGVDRWVPLGELFVDVNILEEMSSSCKSELNDLWQDFSENPSYRSLDRIGLGKERQRVPGLDVLAKNTNLMVVGKPGSGKTTYLQRVVTECNAGNLQAQRIPVLIKLREFVEDGREVAYSLEPYLEKSWQLSKAETQLLFNQGRVLVLLDGLDEVTGENGKNIAKEIKRFARTYPQVQVIVTCRTQSNTDEMNWKSLRFQFVEVADFDEPQVRAFAEHWFKAVMGDESAGLTKARELLAQLFREENKQIRELAITPILLSLTCAVFHQTGKFYSKRSKLYEEGLELLLQRWDESREIERDEIYRDLSLERKLELLSYVAGKKFEQEQYVLFEQAEVEGYIAEFLGIEQRDSRAVLRAMEAQHGLLIERSQKVWSFSHLTFQEYLVAKWFVDSDELEELACHVDKIYWREIFILVITSILNTSDKLLKLMKLEIDKMIGTNKNIQSFLSYIHQEVYNENSPYKPSSIRAFFIGYGSELSSDSLPVKLDYNLLKDYNYALELCDDIESDLGHNLDDYTTVRDMSIANDISSSIQFGIACSIITNTEIRQKLYELRNYQIKITQDNVILNQDNEEEFNELDWEESWQVWREEVCDTIENQSCFHGWELEEDDDMLFQRYYDTNKFLVDCLNSGCTVSNAIRQEIEDTLLLPIAEIEKHKREKAE